MAKRPDGDSNLDAIPYAPHSHLFERRLVHIKQDVAPDVVFAKKLLVLPDVSPAEPSPDVLIVPALDKLEIGTSSTLL